MTRTTTGLEKAMDNARYKRLSIKPDSTLQDICAAKVAEYKTREEYQGWRDEDIYFDILQKMKEDVHRSVASHYNYMNTLTNEPTDPVWGQYTYEEILDMAENGSASIPDDVLQWAKAQANFDSTTYEIDPNGTTDDKIITEMDSDMNDNRVGETKQNVKKYSEIAVSQNNLAEKASKDAEKTNNEIKTQQNNLANEQKDAAQKVEAYEKELKDLEHKIENGETLTNGEQLKYKALAGKINDENKSIVLKTKNIEDEVNNLVDSMNNSQKVIDINEKVADKLKDKSNDFVNKESWSNADGVIQASKTTATKTRKEKSEEKCHAFVARIAQPLKEHLPSVSSSTGMFDNMGQNNSLGQDLADNMARLSETIKIQTNSTKSNLINSKNIKFEIDAAAPKTENEETVATKENIKTENTEENKEDEQPVNETNVVQPDENAENEAPVDKNGETAEADEIPIEGTSSEPAEEISEPADETNPENVTSETVKEENSTEMFSETPSTSEILPNEREEAGQETTEIADTKDTDIEKEEPKSTVRGISAITTKNTAANKIQDAAMQKTETNAKANATTNELHKDEITASDNISKDDTTRNRINTLNEEAKELVISTESTDNRAIKDANAEKLDNIKTENRTKEETTETSTNSINKTEENSNDKADSEVQNAQEEKSAAEAEAKSAAANAMRNRTLAANVGLMSGLFNNHSDFGSSLSIFKNNSISNALKAMSQRNIQKAEQAEAEAKDAQINLSTESTDANQVKTDISNMADKNTSSKNLVENETTIAEQNNEETESKIIETESLIKRGETAKDERQSSNIATPEFEKNQPQPFGEISKKSSIRDEAADVKQMANNAMKVSDKDLEAFSDESDTVRNNANEVEQDTEEHILSETEEALKNPNIQNEAEAESEDFNIDVKDEHADAIVKESAKDKAQQNVNEAVLEVMQSTLSGMNKKEQAKDSDNDKKHKLFTQFEREKKEALIKTVQKVSKAKDAR